MSIADTARPKVLSVLDVARTISKSEGAVRQMIARGQLPARKWGRRVVVLADDLEGMLRGLPRRPQAPEDAA